ncbi:MAG: TRAP transporter substrate-binding protein DctP, partial [Desulfobacterales bacterium]|nr:TRAP transporter substrate-binding protein DctP [Desulfobacterales bacterium]
MIRSAVIKIFWLGFIALSLTMPPAASVAKTLQIKIATLAPEGSSWIKAFHAIDAEVRTKTDKQVGFKFYPGGVLGDEKDMLRKMYIGQIHGAALTSAGLSAIFSEMDVFQIPFLFESHHEVDYVIEEMNAFFQKGIDENDYILLGWSEGGFVRLMSTTPVATLDDLRKVKVWTWEDSPMTKVIFDQANVSAIPLSVPDVLVGLQTGLVDVVY